ATLYIDGLASVQPRDEAHVVRVTEQDLPRRIDRDTAPVEHTVVAGVDERALLGRRRKDALVAQPLEDDPAGEMIERRAAPHVGLANVAFGLVAELRKWLRRRSAISAGRALWHRTLGSWHDQRTVAPIDDVEVATLRGSNQSRDPAARSIEIDETRLA